MNRTGELPGATVDQKMAAFDQMTGRGGWDPAFVPGEETAGAREADRSDAGSPLVDLGRSASPAARIERDELEKEQTSAPPEPIQNGVDAVQQALQSAALGILNTFAFVNGQQVMLTEGAFAKIQEIVLDAAIENLQNQKSMLGRSAETARTAPAVLVPPTAVHEAAPKLRRCKKCGGIGHNIRTCGKGLIGSV